MAIAHIAKKRIRFRGTYRFMDHKRKHRDASVHQWIVIPLLTMTPIPVVFYCELLTMILLLVVFYGFVGKGLRCML